MIFIHIYGLNEKGLEKRKEIEEQLSDHFKKMNISYSFSISLRFIPCESSSNSLEVHLHSEVFKKMTIGEIKIVSSDTSDILKRETSMSPVRILFKDLIYTY